MRLIGVDSEGKPRWAEPSSAKDWNERHRPLPGDAEPRHWGKALMTALLILFGISGFLLTSFHQHQLENCNVSKSERSVLR